MCNFNLTFYFISFAVLWSLAFCKGATHWIVTEDGRIQQQVDSIFNLKSPFDLVTFIHQQNAFDRLKILREEYLEEKRKVIEARENERKQIQTSFYKVDPDCIDAGKHVSEFDLHLDMTLPFTTKGINIPDHVKLCQPLPSHVEPPYCRAELPTVIYSYDHLAGVNNRHQLNVSAEPKLLTALSSYFKNLEELGGHVSVALGKNSSSWVLLNLAAYYWRIKGNAVEAIECLRQALYFSPRRHKDRALMSLAEVLHRANHSYDSLVLLHTAIDTCSELSVYHFLLGNIYASLKMYEMAELCHRFTLVVSPDTTLLCERMKAVRCELKLKELLQERHLDFDETLDSLKTPELDITKLSNGEEVEKRRFLPLETYKRQLERVFVLTQGQGATRKHLDICKSRPGLPKQELRLSSDQVAAKQKHASQVMKSTHNQQDPEHQTENTSSGIQSETLEKAILITEAMKSTTHSEINAQKSSDTSDGESRKSVVKEGDKTSETLKGTNSPSDNSNISVKQKTMQNLEEARLALDRLKSIVKTVSEARHAASGTVDIAEEKVSKSDSGMDSKDGSKTVSAQSKTSAVKSTRTFVERQSKVKKVGETARMGRRGESGFKLKSDSGRREDNSKTVILEETKIAKQKGESIIINKNGPGIKLGKFASKNTREVPSAGLLFEEPKAKGGLPTGPKHTPPLESRAKRCKNIGGKKRKGESFAMECITQDPAAEIRNPTDTDVSIQQAKSEFLKSTTNSEQTQTDSETVLMKQTSADEISATASSNASQTVLEKGQMMTSVGDDAEKREDIKRNGEKASSGSKNSDAKAVEKSKEKATVENVVKIKPSDKESGLKANGAAASNGKESGNVKQNGKEASGGSNNSDAKVVEKSDVKATVENIVEYKPSGKQSGLKENGAAASNGKVSGNVKQNGKEASRGSKNSDAKVIEKSKLKATAKDVVKNKPSGKENENKNIPVEDVVKSKTSDKGGENLQQPNDEKSYDSKEPEKSETKISTVEDVKTKSSDNGKKNSKQPHDHASTTDGETSEKNSKGQKSTSKPKPEQTSADFKSSKTLQSDKAAQNIKEKIKEAELLHKVGAGSNVFETSFLNVHTSGSMQELNEEECKHIEGVQALVIRNKQFSAWLSLDTKNIDVRTHIDFLSEVDDDSPRKPRCTAKIKSNLHTFSGLQGVANAAKLDQVAEAGLTQTLLAIGRTMQDSVDEMGSRIFDGLKKNSTSWVLLNVASLYWRVQGDTAEAIKCLRQALYFSPPKARDVAHVGLASILLREGQLDDTAVVIKKALEISPSLALGHFILGNVFGAQSKIPEAIQHYLLALQLEPGFTPAVERLKIIQCVLWKQQQALEKEASDLRKLLTPN